MKKNIKLLIPAFFLAFFVACGITHPAHADVGISMSPMNQKIILVPGETYEGSFTISNGASNDELLGFDISLQPFYVTENYDIKYENNGDYNQIVNWTTLSIEEGYLQPNQKQEVFFSIDVPLDAPAGGQYLAITATSKNDNDSGVGNTAIKVHYSMAHIVYAEIAGTTVRKGEVSSISVPGFLFSGDISGTSTIKNTGNVHSTAHYTLQVFPLFSSEELYTNEEDPESKTILPDRSLTASSYWADTPTAGIFKVIYTAEFEGVVSQVEKIVIVCPFWLLFVILAAIILILIWLFTKSKKRKSSR